MNVADSQVIDIGFAGVVGADRIADGEEVYDGEFTPLIDRGDSYGPANYLLYVPFEQAFPWDGGLEELPAAHARRDPLRPRSSSACCCSPGAACARAARGATSAIALAFAWLAYPYTLYALNANGGNDAIVAALLVARADRRRLAAQAGPGDRPRRRGQVRAARARAAVRRRHRGAAPGARR